MGYVKEQWLDAMERGYSAPADYFVCPSCVTDSYLAAALSRECLDRPCSYCGAQGSAEIEVLLNEIGDAILAYYDDPANELPYESREGGYQGAVYWGDELVYEMDSWTENNDLLEDVAGAFSGSAWCDRDYFMLDEFETLSYGWEAFSQQVKHRTRFLVPEELGQDDPYGPNRDEIPPGRMLASLGHLFAEYELYCTLPAETEFVRARVVSKGERPVGATALGTAPPERALYPNRMSPAGIPMFYGAFDELTAIQETYEQRSGPRKDIALARFRNSRPLTLLDLTDLPDVPSRFDRENRHKRLAIQFLRAFEADFTKPVPRDRTAIVEYVPTQAVTEYVRHRLRSPDGGSVDGVQYRSSRAEGSKAVVIFADSDHCGPRENRGRWDPEPYMLLTDVQYVAPDVFMGSASAVTGGGRGRV